MRSLTGRLILPVLVLSAVLVAAATPAQAAPTRTTTNAATAAAGWLAQRFVGPSHQPSPSGDHLESKFGGQFFFDGGTTADAIFGLAAAKAGKSKIDAVIAYFAEHVDEYTSIHDTSGKPGPFDGSVGKVALAATVAGADPHQFGGFDLLKALKDDECTSVSVQTTDFTVPNCPAVGAGRNIFSSVAESFVILAEARAGGAFAPSAAAVAYFLSLQCANGGFTVQTDATGGCTSDLDSTSYAAAALAALGGHTTELGKALTWLATKRNANGSWTAQGGPNVDSTGLAASALAAAGQDVGGSRAWLASQQVTSGVTIGATASRGALRYQGAFDPTASVKATADGLLGLAEGASLATLTDKDASADAPVMAPTASLGHSSIAQGAQQTVTGVGFNAGESVRATVHSVPVFVGKAAAQADGTAKVTFIVPAGLSTGAHTVVLTGLTSGLSTSSPFTVIAAPPSATPTSSAPVSAPAGSSEESGGVQTPTSLPATGTDGNALVLQAIAGFALISAGTLAILAGRRRRRT
jgi:hypothetical protein